MLQPRRIWTILLILFFVTYTSYRFMLSKIFLNIRLKPIVKEFQIAPIEKLTLEEGNITRTNFKLKLSLNEEGRIIRDSCRHEQWRDILRPCMGAIKWKQKNYNFSSRTNLFKSKIELIIKPRGYPSIIAVSTRDNTGRIKTYGGDSWLVRIHGNNYSSTIHLKDRLNGRYHGVFVMKQEGIFSVIVYLEYSLCDGLRDPPINWFQKGTIQGKFQDQSVLGVLNDFLNEKSRNISFNIKGLGTEPVLNAVNVIKQNKTSMIKENHCGYWKEKDYYIADSKEKKKYDLLEVKNKLKRLDLQTLMIYGDSMAKRFLESINATGACDNIFKSCRLAYIWIYKQKGLKDAHIYDGKDFDPKRFLNDIKIDLIHETMKTNKSYFVINFGLHVIMALPFQKAKLLFRSFLIMLENLKKLHGEENFPHVIWKTTSPPRPEYYSPNVAHVRFLTRPRMYLWNAYTIREACKVNLPVLDVYNMALSNRYGALDLVHYQNYVFKRAEKQLMQYILR